MKLHEVITIHPQVHSGTPVFKGTRIPVTTFLDAIRAGDSINDFVRDYEIDRSALVDFLLYLENEFGGPGYESFPIKREDGVYENPA